MAYKAGVRELTIARYEKTETTPGHSMLHRLADIFGLPDARAEGEHGITRAQLLDIAENLKQSKKSWRRAEKQREKARDHSSDVSI